MSDKILGSSAVLLLLGIYPTNDGNYIALPYSPAEIGPKIDFPLSYYTGDLHSVAVRYVLDILDAAVASVDQRFCQPLMQPTRNMVISVPKVITQGQSAAINVGLHTSGVIVFRMLIRWEEFIAAPSDVRGNFGSVLTIAMYHTRQLSLYELSNRLHGVGANDIKGTSGSRACFNG